MQLHRSLDSSTLTTDVLVIGAGPAGSMVGAILARRGRSVLCLESAHFPRHVIGESLLPRCNALLEQAGMLDAVRSRGYMVKRGAVFLCGDRRERFCFADGLDGEHPDTFQVPRDDFDQLLAAEARRAGSDLRFGQRVDHIDFDPEDIHATVTDLDHDRVYRVRTRFVIDCSGYGRVLPRLLRLERPAPLPSRVACYAQMENDLRPEGEQMGDIWICVHPTNGWIWIIPFSNGRTSVGMVCDSDHWDRMNGSEEEKLVQFLNDEPNTRVRLASARTVAPTRVIKGYSKKVETMHGEGWVLVGNAGDFLDPVFSSGVTLALESASLAAGLVDRSLTGEQVQWEEEYDAVIGKAVGVFRAFIDSWYSRELEAIFFAKMKLPKMKRFITSILGGHVLRENNPLINEPAVGLKRLHEAVRG